jgi:Flp pilus assembly protein TadB
VSRTRAQARAERERVAAEAAARRAAEAHRTARTRGRRAAWSLRWKRVRLWQHGAQFRRRRETWGVVGTLILLALLLAYLLTRSVQDVIGTALILVIAAPVLVAFLFDRSRK